MNPFQVNTSKQPLYVAKSQYTRVAPTSTAKGDAFYGTTHHFRWDSNGADWTSLSESYLKARIKLADESGDPLLLNTGIAPASGTLSTLFTKLELLINGQTVGRVEGNVAEIDALLTRQTKSSAWLDTVGELNLYGKDFDERRQLVSSDGVTHGTVGTETLTSKQDLGFDDGDNIAYDNATGLITITAGSAAPLPDVHKAFPIGSSVKPSPGLPITLRVEKFHPSELNKFYVVAGATGADIPADDGDWARADLTGGNEASRRISSMELCWNIQPLSLMRSPMSIPSGAQFELLMTVGSKSNTNRRAIASDGNTTPIPSPEANANYSFSVTELAYMVKTYTGGNVHDGKAVFDVSSIACNKINNLQDSYTSYQTQVSSSTGKLTIAFQDKRLENGNYSPCKFRSESNADQKISRYNIQYDGQVKPSQDPQLEFKDNTDFLVGEQYLQTQAANGVIRADCGGESMRDFVENGVYFTHDWERVGGSFATTATINTAFESGTDMTHTQLLVFAESASSVTLMYQNGRVIDVVVEDR
jgi:hypothetical protein